MEKDTIVSHNDTPLSFSSGCKLSSGVCFNIFSEGELPSSSSSSSTSLHVKKVSDKDKDKSKAYFLKVKLAQIIKPETHFFEKSHYLQHNPHLYHIPTLSQLQVFLI